MKTLTRLFTENEGLVIVVTKWMRLLRVKVTETTIKEDLMNHTNYPSLLSLSEILTLWKIENAALSLSINQLHEIDVPFVTTLANHKTTDFILVTKTNDRDVFYTDQSRSRSMTLKEFEQRWSGSLLLAEAGPSSGESGYEGKQKAARKRSMLFITLCIFTILSVVMFATSQSTWYWMPAMMIITSLTGIGAIKALVDIGLAPKNNAVIGLCMVSQKTDCKAVVNSSVSGLFGINLSEIGLIFFLYTLVLVCISFDDPGSSYNTILLWLHLLSIPYSLFLIYYQWRIIRMWCPLCLIVQSIVWINAALLLSEARLFAPISLYNTYTCLSIFACPSLLWMLVRPAFESGLASAEWRRKYYRIKGNREIFEAYLQTQKRMPEFDTFNPMVLGNPNADDVITVVLSVKCDPCAKLFDRLERALDRNENVKVNVVFSACHVMNLSQGEVISHVLEMDRHQEDAAGALRSWYESHEKDYESWLLRTRFAGLPVNRRLLEEHCNWCVKAQVDRTPTIFMNGFQGPPSYELDELIRFADMTAKRKTTVSKVDLVAS